MESIETDNILRVKKNPEDSEAWNRLYLYYRNYLLKIIGSIIYDSSIHTDILQNIWLKVFRSISRFDENRNFKVWICKIAINECRSCYKNRKNSREVYGSEDAIGPYEINRLRIDTYDDDFREEPFINDFENTICDRLTIKSALSGIQNKKHVLAFKYRYINGLSIEQIAGIFSEEAKTVKNWIYRTRDKLKSKLEESKKM